MEENIRVAKQYYSNIKLVIKDLYSSKRKELYVDDVLKEFDNHLINILLSIATCHYPASKDEIKFVESFFPQYKVKELLEKESENVTKEREEFVLTKFPKYLNDINEMDYSKYRIIINMLLEICVELASADSNFSEDECKFIADIGGNLKKEYTVPKTNIKSLLSKYRNMKQPEQEKETIKEEKQESLEEIMEEVDELIGLEKIKLEINTLINLTKVNNLRKKRGLKTVSMSRHMVFTGNPGTGKTTIARIIARIYKALGVLSKGHLVETDRAGLVAGYVGQTAANVKKVVDSAIGGVLFIDEAYTLTYSEDSNDFGKEAVDTLVKLMEDNREDLVVIVAGYENEMKDFINSNPGLSSRFNKYINFLDYTESELFEIFMLLVNKNGFIIPEETTVSVKEMLNRKSKEENFGNGRGVRNCFEKILEVQANRVVGIADITDNELQTILVGDVNKI